MTCLDSLRRPEVYPRSAAYEPQSMVDRCMGPNPLWLLEDLARDCQLRPGMKVLDLRCGMGMTSVFLAREYGAQVWAAEHWIPVEDNMARFRSAGMDGQVHAVAAETHALPFAEGQFDVVVAVDSYHYFGSADVYFGYITTFLVPGGQLAIAVPAVRRELRDLGGIPDHIRADVGWEALSFHTPEWWQFQWEQSRLIEVTAAREQPGGWADWKLGCEVCAEHSPHEMVRQGSRDTLRMLERDQGNLLTFALITSRTASPADQAGHVT